MSGVATTASIEVRSPYDGRTVGEAPRASADDVARAVERAHAALESSPPQHERAAILERAAGIARERHEQLATTIMEEAGKPIAAARVEAARAVDTLAFSAVEARGLAGEVVPMEASTSGAGHLAYTVRRPIGVVAAITPFNFPLNLSCHKIGPAVAAGCPVVHKPASATPLSALALHGIMIEAGLPEDRYQVVCGGGGDVGAALAGDPRVAMVTFTGSSDVGWCLRAELPRTRVALELGNSTPLIVCADAEIADVATLVAQHGFSFAGQSCISIQRVLVERAVYDDAVAAIAGAVGALGVGDPADDATHVGPLIDAAAAGRIRDRLSEAIRRGAQPVLGVGAASTRWDDHPTVVVPTVLADVSPEFDVFRNELFGPAVVVTAFDGDDGAARLANATDFGLQAGIVSVDVTRALAIASRLEFGGITINEAPTFRADQMPYGGVKASGTTREGPRSAVREMTESQLVVLMTAR